jgi:tetratricopeptide (TPR) repeat protein
MKGRYGLEQGTPESLAQAGLDFQRAIDIDPDYAAAYFGLGQAEFAKAAATGLYVRTAIERERAEYYFRKALELDPDLPTAHAALARLALQYDWDWGRAEREIQAGLAGPPSAAPESAYAAFLIARGRFAEADTHLRRCEDLDPFSTTAMLNLASMRNLEGRFAEARQISQQLAAAYPQIPGGRQLIGLTYIEEGRPDLALADLEALKQYVPFATFREAMARARAGQREDALRLIRPFEEKYPNTGVSIQWVATVYAFMGDEPNTVKWLGRSADQHEWAALNIAVNPVYAPMRNSPGFRAIEKRMGLIQ